MIDWSKPIQTFKGKPAKFVYCLKTNSPQCMVVVVEDVEDNLWVLTREGKSVHTPIVRNVPEEKTFWLNIYPMSLGVAHSCKEEADTEANFRDLAKRIACVKITYKEGEGLD